MKDITKEVLKELVRETRSELPFTLEPKQIIELTGYSRATVYKMLEAGEIPGAKNLRGWRVPRDVFLAWWYGEEQDNEDVIKLTS